MTHGIDTTPAEALDPNTAFNTLGAFFHGVMGVIGITTPFSFQFGWSVGRVNSPHAVDPVLTIPEARTMHMLGEKMLNLQRNDPRLHFPRDDPRLRPHNLPPNDRNRVPGLVGPQASVATMSDAVEDVVDVPTFLGVPIGPVMFNGVRIGVQGTFGFSPASPAFGWTDPTQITFPRNAEGEPVTTDPPSTDNDGVGPNGNAGPAPDTGANAPDAGSQAG